MWPEIPPIEPETLERFGGPAPRYTSYPTVPHWLEARGSEARRNAVHAAGGAAPLSLYVHVPFCESMCDFCGCNVIVRKDRVAADAYLQALEHEIENLPSVLSLRPIRALHLGGGTPTFLRVEQLERLVQILGKAFDLSGAELALEVNPTSTTVAQIKTLADLGFRRISLGVQDTDPTVLAGVGRQQTLSQTLRIMEAARGAGFTAVNVDLIYGLPHQTVRSWAGTLDEVAKMRPDRIAAFAFAYVPQLRPNQRRLDADALPDPGLRLSLYRQAYQLLLTRGYRAIGMDHFALPDDALAIADAAGTMGRNFQGYVTDDRVDLLGLGVSAISHMNGVYTQNLSRMGLYRAALARRLPTLQRACRPTYADVRRRRVITRLMCHQDTDLAPLDPGAAELAAFERLASHGLVELIGETVRMTPRSRPFLRAIAAAADPMSRAVQQPVRSQL